MTARILTRAFSIGLIIAVFAMNLYGASARKLVQEGNKAYRAEKFDEALAKYKAALMAGGDPGVVAYNLGNTHYTQGESEAAQAAYMESLQPQRARELSESLYNLGNAYLQGQKFPEAIATYIEALKRNPDDVNAKFNLELARRMMQQQQQNQNQQNQEKQENQQQDKQDSQENKEQQEKEQQQEQEQEQQQKQQQQEQEKQESQPQMQEQRQMTPEEAEKLLNALLQDEQDALKEVKKVKVAARPKREKDW